MRTHCAVNCVCTSARIRLNHACNRNGKQTTTTTAAAQTHNQQCLNLIVAMRCHGNPWRYAGITWTLSETYSLHCADYDWSEQVSCVRLALQAEPQPFAFAFILTRVFHQDTRFSRLFRGLNLKQEENFSRCFSKCQLLGKLCEKIEKCRKSSLGFSVFCRSVVVSGSENLEVAEL